MEVNKPKPNIRIQAFDLVKNRSKTFTFWSKLSFSKAVDKILKVFEGGE